MDFCRFMSRKYEIKKTQFFFDIKGEILEANMCETTRKRTSTLQLERELLPEGAIQNWEHLGKRKEKRKERRKRKKMDGRDAD